MTPPDTLWRFPGPLALAAVLRGAPPTLHHADAARVFVGDLALWDWPGVDEFGALTLFGARALAPRPGEVAGWYVVDVRALDVDRVLYVPDRGCARAVRGCADARAARSTLPPGYDAAVGEARRAMARYDEVSRRVVAAREELGEPGVPPGLRTAVDTPLHLLPRSEREALMADLEAAVAAGERPS